MLISFTIFRQFKSSNEYLESNHIVAANDPPLKKLPDSGTLTSGVHLCEYLCRNHERVDVHYATYPLAEEVLDLNSMLPQDMIVDNSLLDVSTVIGQGLCKKMTQAIL